MNDLVTRLLLNSTQFDNNLSKSAQQVRNFQRTANNAGSMVSKSFGSMAGAVTKLIPQVAALYGGFEAFNKIIGSTQTLTDEFGRTMEATKSSIDRFFVSIANGDFSNFFDGLQNTIKLAREAYNAIDSLGTYTITSDAELAKIQSQIAKVKYEIKAGINVEANNELLTQLENKQISISKTKAKKAMDAFYTDLRKELSKQGFNKPVFQKSLDNIFGSADSYNNYSDWYKRQNKKIDDLKSKWWNSHSVIEQEEIDKQIESIKNNPTYQLLKAAAEIGDDELRKSYSYSITASNAIGQAYNTMSANLKVHNKALKETATTHKSITKELKEQADLSGVYSTLQNGISTGVGTQLRLDETQLEELKKEIAKLPEEEKNNFKKIFTDYTNEIKALEVQFKDGIISAEDFNKAKDNSTKKLYSSLIKMGLNTGANFGSITNSLASNILGNQANVDYLENLKEQSKQYEQSKQLFDDLKTQFNLLNPSAGPNLTGGFDKKVEQIEKAKKAAEQLKDLFNTLKDSGTLKGFNSEIDGYIDSLTNYIDNLDNLSDRYTIIVKKNAELQDSMNNLGDVANSLSSMFSQVGQSLQSIGDAQEDVGAKTVGFVLQQVGAISNLISQYASLISAASAASIAKGVESSSMLPFPYNIVAMATTVGTIVSSIASGIAFSKSIKGKFADGGIVGGSSYIGDMNTVRVNSGEMILNKHQQANLFGLIANGAKPQSSSGGQVEFVIRGKELHGVLNNYNNKRSKLL